MENELTQDNMKKPLLHYSPEKNWMNDPNGLVFYKDEFHLFYQHNPHSSVWGEMHWGHALSQDGITWLDEEIALSPHGNIDHIFSGCGVLDKNNCSGFFGDRGGIVLLFTGVSEGGGKSNRIEHQYIAFLDDSTGKVTIPKSNRIIENPGLKDFRDPKVIYEEESRLWLMVIACGDHIGFYTSNDLKCWEREGSFYPEISNPDIIVECPGIFKCKESGEVSLRGVYFSTLNQKTRVSETYYLIGDMINNKFIPLNSEINLIDSGHDFYAPQHWDLSGLANNTEQNPLWIGWMNNWAYADDFPGIGWNGIMSSVRETFLVRKNGKLLLGQKPLSRIAEKRLQKVLAVPAGAGLQYGLDRTAAYEIRMELSLSIGNRIAIYLSEKSGKDFVFTIDPMHGLCSLDRTNCCTPEMSGKNLVRKSCKIGGGSDKVDLVVLIDFWTIEIFLDEGTIVFSEMLNWDDYPDTLFLKTEDPVKTILSVDCWELGENQTNKQKN